MATRTDLVGIKEQIQTVLQAANTTTSTPIDLSANLSGSKRVRQILKIHPEMIRPQASFFPMVTCYVTEKAVTGADIAKDQLGSQRRAKVSVNIVGSLWNDNFQNIEEDPADEDIGYLMENIELALRANHSLNGVVNWQVATGCKYYNTNLDEQTHLRSGILTLECDIFY